MLNELLMTLELKCRIEEHRQGVTAEAVKVWTWDYTSRPGVTRNLPVVITGHSENVTLRAG